MSLNIIVPAAITETNIVANNIPREDEWANDVGYIANNIVRHNTDRWKSLSANTGSEPSTANKTNWVLLGAENLLAAFEQQAGVGRPMVSQTKTTGGTSIEWTLEDLGLVTSIGFRNIKANTIDIVVTNALAEEVYSYSYTMRDLSQTANIWQYFEHPWDLEDDHVARDIFCPSGSTLKITLTHASGEVEAGTIAIGRALSFGKVSEAKYESFDLSTYSREADLITNIIRPGADRYTISLAILDADYSLQRTLRRLKTKSAFFFIDGRDYVRVFGRVSGPDSTATVGGIDYWTVEVEET